MRPAAFLAFLTPFLWTLPCLATDGMDVFRTAESVRVAKEATRAKHAAVFGKLAGTLLERGLGGPALKVLDVVEALDPGNTETGKTRDRASGLKGGTPADQSWAREKVKAATTDALKTWNGLLDLSADWSLRATGRSIALTCLALDPEHAKTRAFLGHVKKGGAWTDPETAGYAAAGKTFRPSWGYVSKEEEAKLESGLRPLGGKWVPRAEERSAARSWSDPLDLEAGRIRVRSTLPFDLTKDVLLRMRERYARFDAFFGDFFPACKTTCTLLLARTEGDYLEILKKHEYSPDLAQYESFYQPGTGLLFVNGPVIGLAAKGMDALEGSDTVSRDLCIWVLMQDPSAGSCQGPGYWCFLGARLLVECSNLETPRRPQGGRLTEWKAREANDSRPSFANLPTWDGQDCVANPEVGAYALGLCHFLVHGNGGARRGPFLAYLRNYVFGYPPGEAEKALGLSDPGLETAVDAHMKALLGR
jgi:hypothetical protein